MRRINVNRKRLAAPALVLAGLLAVAGLGSASAAIFKPVISPSGGAVPSGKLVKITDATTDAAIYYTTDGSTPSATNGTAYTASFAVTKAETVKAIAVLDGSSSKVATAIFTLEAAAATPVISPAAGTVPSGQLVTFTDATPNAVIHYTVNGSTPSTTHGKIYSAPFAVSSAETVTAIAVAKGYSNSALATAAFTLEAKAVTPVIKPEKSSIPSGQLITITDATLDAAIYYTTDGSTPSAINGSTYTAPFAVTSAETIKAVAVASGYSSSSVARAAYTLESTAATPVISPAAGAVTSGQLVAITDATSNATIYYTVDGSTPSSTHGKKYSAPFAVTRAETVTAVAAAKGYVNSALATASYTVMNSISGVVSSGSLPVAGATVQLYAAGTSGYGTGASILSTVPSSATTSSTGSFTLSYACPAAPADQVYLVATGGKFSNGSANPEIAMMTALGTCGKLASNASFTINEVTTIASAYALSAFSTTNSGGGIHVGAPGTGSSCNAADKWLSTGANTCNYTGLFHAFNTVNNLVNPTTGAARTHTPAYPTNLAGDANILNNSTVPTTRINALADMLASCVESSSGCSALFTGATTGEATTTSTPNVPNVTPTDTLQAALNIAQNPGNNVSTLLGLVPTANQPYSTGTLVLSGTGSPTDLTLALTYTGAGLGISHAASATATTDPEGCAGISLHLQPLSNTGLVIDASNNIWVASFATTGGEGYGEGFDCYVLAEFNSLGAPLTPATTINPSTSVASLGGFNPSLSILGNTDGPAAIAIDQAGNIWTVDDEDGQVFKISTAASSLSVLSSSIMLGGSGNYLAFDNSSNLWVSNSAGAAIQEYQNNGTADMLSAGPALNNINYITFDSNGGLWVADQEDLGPIETGNPDVDELSTSTGAIEFQAFTDPSAPGKAGATLVADGSGNVYGCADSKRHLDVFNSGAWVNSSTASAIATGRACGTQLVLDGQGHFFAVNDSAWDTNQIDEFTTAGVLISPKTSGYTGNSSTESPTLNPNGWSGAFGGAGGAAIDGSGNLWVINGDVSGAYYNSTTNKYVFQSGNALVEYVGIGAPVVTPVSVALTNKMLGARP